MTPLIHPPNRDSRELEKVLVGLLSRRRLTLALAESCTGGFIANQITNVPGASKVFLGGCCRLQQRGEGKISRRAFEILAEARRGERSRRARNGRRRAGKIRRGFCDCSHGHRRAGRRDEKQAGGNGFHRAGRRRGNGGRTEIKFLRPGTIQANHGKPGPQNAAFAVDVNMTAWRALCLRTRAP